MQIQGLTPQESKAFINNEMQQYASLENDAVEKQKEQDAADQAARDGSA